MTSQNQNSVSIPKIGGLTMFTKYFRATLQGKEVTLIAGGDQEGHSMVGLYRNPQTKRLETANLGDFDILGTTDDVLTTSEWQQLAQLSAPGSSSSSR